MNIATASAIKRGEAIVVGDKVYVYCHGCGEYVQMNKFIFGGLHFCAESRVTGYDKGQGA